MANFNIAEKITGKFEGFYADNTNDRGGETFAGIARNFWSKWEGWKKIDEYKAHYKASGSKTSLANWVNNSAKVVTEPTMEMVSKFYKTNFWDVNKLDAIVDQQLANTVYDFGVNSGTGRAAKFLQQSANDTGLVILSEDGNIGPKTIGAINALNPQNVYANFNRRRESFYRSIATGNQEQFLKSWLNRLKPYVKCN
jgi:lysozyme family protein